MRFRAFAAALVFIAALFLGGAQLRAQAHAPATQAESVSEGEHGTAHGTEAGSHHGPEVKLFGITLGQPGQFAVRVVNFGIFFAILYFVLKGALSSAFKARAKELEEQLSQAEKDKTEGEAQIRELEARVAGMQADLDGIMARTEADAEAEKARILEAARAEAAQILLQTQAEIDSQKRLAEKELRALVAELAIEGATRRLEARVQGATAEQVLDRAIETVGGVQ